MVKMRFFEVRDRRCDGYGAEALAAAKVFGVVGDDIAASGGKCEFKNHVIVCIGQEGTLEKEDVM